MRNSFNTKGHGSWGLTSLALPRFKRMPVLPCECSRDAMYFPKGRDTLPAPTAPLSKSAQPEGTAS